MQKLLLLAEAVAEHYVSDPTTAGLVIAKLGTNWYVSIRRYRGSFASYQNTVCSATSPSFSKAVDGCTHNFLKEIGCGVALEKLKATYKEAVCTTGRKMMTKTKTKKKKSLRVQP